MVRNLVDELARAVVRWFQGVIVYWRHLLAPGVSMMDRWHMILALKMYFNDIVLFFWMIGGLVTLTFSGMKDRLFVVPRLLEFSNVTITQLINQVTVGHFAALSPVGIALTVGVGLFVIMAVLYLLNTKTNLGDKSVALKWDQKNKWKSIKNGLKYIFVPSLTGFLSYVLVGGPLFGGLFVMPSVMALFSVAVGVMIYFAIFMGGKKGDAAGFVDFRTRPKQTFITSIISLNRPILTTKAFLGNLLRDLAHGSHPRTASDKESLKARKMKGAYLISGALLIVSIIIPWIYSVSAIPLIAGAILISLILPFIASRWAKNYVPMAWVLTGLGAVALGIGIFAVWGTPILNVIGSQLMNGLVSIQAIPGLTPIASSISAFFGDSNVLSVGFWARQAIKLLVSVSLLERINKALGILPEPLPWIGFSAKAGQSGLLTLPMAGILTRGSFVTLLFVLLSSVFIWSHQWVLLWGITFVASWGLGFVAIWYSSKAMYWSGDNPVEDYIEQQIEKKYETEAKKGKPPTGEDLEQFEAGLRAQLLDQAKKTQGRFETIEYAERRAAAEAMKSLYLPLKLSYVLLVWSIFLVIPYLLVWSIFMAHTLGTLVFGVAITFEAAVLMTVLLGIFSRPHISGKRLTFGGFPSIMSSLHRFVAHDFQSLWKGGFHNIDMRDPKKNGSMINYLLARSTGKPKLEIHAAWVRLQSDIIDLVSSALFTFGVVIGFLAIGAVVVGVPIYLYAGIDHFILPGASLGKVIFQFVMANYLPAAIASFILPRVFAALFAAFALPFKFFGRFLTSLYGNKQLMAYVEIKAPNSVFSVITGISLAIATVGTVLFAAVPVGFLFTLGFHSAAWMVSLGVVGVGLAWLGIWVVLRWQYKLDNLVEQLKSTDRAKRALARDLISGVLRPREQIDVWLDLLGKGIGRYEAINSLEWWFRGKERGNKEVINTARSKVIDALLPLLRDQDTTIRQMSAHAIGRIFEPVSATEMTEKKNQVVALLLSAGGAEINAGNEKQQMVIRNVISVALGRIGSLDSQSFLVDHLLNDQDDVRWGAAQGLGLLRYLAGKSPQKDTSVAMLSQILTDESRAFDVRASVAVSLLHQRQLNAAYDLDPQVLSAAKDILERAENPSNLTDPLVKADIPPLASAILKMLEARTELRKPTTSRSEVREPVYEDIQARYDRGEWTAMQAVEEMLRRQVEADRFIKGFRTEDEIIKSIANYPMGEYYVGQINPARKDRRKGITGAKEGCFLCEGNMPPNEKGFRITAIGNQQYLVVPNPFPVAPYHMVMVWPEHLPQFMNGKILQDLLRVARQLPGIDIAHNGFAGASIPDHQHFHVLKFQDMELTLANGRRIKGLPLDTYIQEAIQNPTDLGDRLEKLYEAESIQVFKVHGWYQTGDGREVLAYVIEGKDGEDIAKLSSYFLQALGEIIPDSTHNLKILALGSGENDPVRLVIFPRRRGLHTKEIGTQEMAGYPSIPPEYEDVILREPLDEYKKIMHEASISYEQLRPVEERLKELIRAEARENEVEAQMLKNLDYRDEFIKNAVQGVGPDINEIDIITTKGTEQVTQEIINGIRGKLISQEKAVQIIGGATRGSMMTLLDLDIGGDINALRKKSRLVLVQVGEGRRMLFGSASLGYKNKGLDKNPGADLTNLEQRLLERGLYYDEEGLLWFSIDAAHAPYFSNPQKAEVVDPIIDENGKVIQPGKGGIQVYVYPVQLDFHEDIVSTHGALIMKNPKNPEPQEIVLAVEKPGH
ncbi:MAG: hypothetical protein HY351_01370, partial [Candidatus Omnitrophica bacterium]|nr:hypothetical protein [Candidatus Omnitrophota bacterium]